MTKNDRIQRSAWPAALLLVVLAAAAKAPSALPSLFFTSDRCVACHNGLVTPQGEDISFGTSWRPTMMANSARDPYWQASVRRETIVHASARPAIENECAACHMPMTRFEAKTAGRMAEVFANLPAAGPAAAQSPEAVKARDGVACSMCHQIKKDNLGQRSSFVAGFVVDTTTRLGERQIFGPYEVDKGRQALMRSSARFLPVQGPHIREAELCATCHTLITEALDGAGRPVGELPEQVPYLEWKHSGYAGARSCQSCHMPAVETAVPVTGVLGQPRSEVGRHIFLAGNFLMPIILNIGRDELGVGALPQDLEAAARRTMDHLETASARLSIEKCEARAGRLEALVRVENHAGHKLPTAYPSRRAWIHLAVRNGAGDVVFESGRMKPDGSIAGNDNDRDAGAYEPHYARIERPDQVQIYEGILGSPDGAVTTVLLTATRYLKDNRLLPDGFDKAAADVDIAVRGGAFEDAEFSGGGHRVLYAVDLGDARGPFKVEAELWYQPVGYRWAHNLEQQDTAEARRFLGFYDAVSKRSAAVLAKAMATAGAEAP
jgi:cytochrome c551/c552